MSLTDDISQLISRVNSLLNLFDSKSAQMDAKVAEAIAAAPLARKIVWVDPVAGNDTNTGLSAAAAFLTLERAIEVTANVPVVYVNLLGDAVMKKRVETFSQVIHFGGVDKDGNEVLRTVKFNAVATNSAAASGTDAVTAGFKLRQGVDIRSSKINWVLPNIATTIGIPFVFGVNFSAVFVLDGGTIDIEASTSTALLIGTWSSVNPVQLWLNSVTITANARGHILTGVAASADPNAKVNYKSNITAL